MPIRSLLSETSFNSEQTKIIAKAFDDAWDQVRTMTRPIPPGLR